MLTTRMIANTETITPKTCQPFPRTSSRLRTSEANTPGVLDDDDRRGDRPERQHDQARDDQQDQPDDDADADDEADQDQRHDHAA